MTNATANPHPPVQATRQRRALALSLMAVAALFTAAVIGVMVEASLAPRSATPPMSPRIESLRQSMQTGAANAQRLDELRREDARLRRAYFTARRRLRSGAYLLLVGVIALVLCAKWRAALAPAQPMPPAIAERTDAGRWLSDRRHKVAAIISVAGAPVAGLAVLSVSVGSPLPPKPQPAAQAPDHGFKENWPRFRGPGGLGIVKAGDWPQHWDAKTGENILWKTAVPGVGKNSPVIWGDRIFLTTGDERKREVFAFGRKTGKLLWRTEVKSPPRVKSKDEEPIDVPEDTTYAAPTAATDGKRVYVTFATADLAALDFNGRVLWVKNFGRPHNVYGMATSLLCWGSRVIFKLDRGMGAEDKLSSIMALDGATGRILWRTPRPVGASWSTPIIIPADAGPQIITCARGWVISYDPLSGAEMWRVKGINGDCAPCPAFANGKVFVTVEYADVMAIRTDGAGDVSKTHVLWRGDEGMADVSSPVCDDRLFFQAHSSGYLTCYDAQSGKLVWEHDLEDSILASPTLVGKLVYLPDEKGKMHIFQLARKFHEITTADIGEPQYASPAFADSRIYIRGDLNLYCIAKSK